MSGNRDWTNHELRQAVWRLASGEDVEDVARALGRSPTGLESAIERYSPWPWGQIMRWGRYNRRHDVICAYLRSEISLEEAGRRLDLAPHYLHLYMAREGYQTRKGQPRRRVHQHPVSMERRAFVLRQSGLTYAQVGAELGLSYTTAHRLVKRYERRMASWGGRGG